LSLETFSLPESGGLIVIGSLLISGAVFLRFRRKRAP
jgi:LPXTG-motif cell wall-anchored protein